MSRYLSNKGQFDHAATNDWLEGLGFTNGYEGWEYYPRPLPEDTKFVGVYGSTPEALHNVAHHWDNRAVRAEALRQLRLWAETP